MIVVARKLDDIIKIYKEDDKKRYNKDQQAECTGTTAKRLLSSLVLTSLSKVQILGYILF